MKPGQLPIVQDKINALFPPVRKGGRTTMCAIHTRLMKELTPLPHDPRHPNPAAYLLTRWPGDWYSFEWSVLCLVTPVFCTAADMAVTALRLALECGIEPGRLGLAMVAARGLGNQGSSHVVCIWRDGQHWRVVADAAQRHYQASAPIPLAEVYDTVQIGRCSNFELDMGFNWIKAGNAVEIAEKGLMPPDAYWPGSKASTLRAAA
ncbi:MAG: hypothetical protein AAGK66_02795 [Pseudomonadota bacterium]